MHFQIRAQSSFEFLMMMAACVLVVTAVILFMAGMIRTTTDGTANGFNMAANLSNVSSATPTAPSWVTAAPTAIP